MRVHPSSDKSKDAVPINVVLVKDDALAVIFEITIGRLCLAIGCSLESSYDGPLLARRILVDAIASADTALLAQHLHLVIHQSPEGVRISQTEGWYSSDNFALSSFGLQLRAEEWRTILDLMKARLLPK